MIMRLLVALSLTLSLATPLHASSFLFRRGGSPGSSPAYVGPGDVTPLDAYWGLGAYTAAIAAAGTQPLITLKKTSNSHTCDLIVATNGGVGLTGNCSTGGDNGQTDLSFCTSTVGGTVTISGATLTASAGTFNNFDIIYGAGIIKGTEIIAVGGGGTYTVTPPQTVSTPTAITTTDCYPTVFPDQTHNNACTASSCDLTANTRGGAGQPDRIYYVLNCFGTQPCLSSGGDDTFFATSLGTNNRVTPATGVVSLMAEAQRLAYDGSSTNAIVVAENSDTQNLITFQTLGLNKVHVQGGTSGSVLSNTYSDTPTAFHSVIGVIGSGTNNSSITVDGSTVVGTAVGSTVTAHPNILIDRGPQLVQLKEAGFKDNVAWNSTTIANLYANQVARRGSP